MHRRAFLACLCGGLLTLPAAVSAQKADKVARVGILSFGTPPSPQELAKSVATNPFWSSMKQLGWVYGQNVVVERRFGESTEQLRQGAAALVRLITGSPILNDDLVPKRLELLKALVPHLAKVAVVREGLTELALPEVAARYDQHAVVAARTLHLDVHTFAARGTKDLTTTKTAKALGLTVPPAVLARADEAIQ